MAKVRVSPSFDRRHPNLFPVPQPAGQDLPAWRSDTDFPRKVKEIENLWIPMSDGIKLAARMWLPEDAEEKPVPAILEYLPYRKRDGTIVRDALTHPYFAGHGYAAIRVDMRGNGDSEGLMLDEYTKQEQDDALEVIAWLARQKWCTGQGRHDRHFLGRLQRAAGRGAQAPGAQGHRHPVLDRRPL